METDKPSAEDTSTTEEKAQRRAAGIQAQQDRREAKLKSALRQNLQRRKQKARSMPNNRDDSTD